MTRLLRRLTLVAVKRMDWRGESLEQSSFSGQVPQCKIDGVHTN